MHEDIKKRYNFSHWSKIAERGASLLLGDFTPWREDCLNWNRESKSVFPEAASRRLLRTVWDDPNDVDARVLVDVREMTSSANARKCMLEVLANNEMMRLPEGPDDLGEVCFVHPEGAPPAVFWVTGNLCVSVASFGRKSIRVLDWGYKLHSRMVDKPLVEKLELALVPRATRMKVKEEQPLGFSLPRVLSDEGYFKFFVTGAELLLKKGEVHVRASQQGEIVVQVFVVEPGRPAEAGRVEMSAS
jgi:hypothetical protein